MFVRRSAYAASKHALQAFCDTLRAEVAHHNVHVTVVSPGYIRTNLSLNAVTGTGEKYGGKRKSSTRVSLVAFNLTAVILKLVSID